MLRVPNEYYPTTPPPSSFDSWSREPSRQLLGNARLAASSLDPDLLDRFLRRFYDEVDAFSSPNLSPLMDEFARAGEWDVVGFLQRFERNPSANLLWDMTRASAIACGALGGAPAAAVEAVAAVLQLHRLSISALIQDLISDPRVHCLPMTLVSSYNDKTLVKKDTSIANAQKHELFALLREAIEANPRRIMIVPLDTSVAVFSHSTMYVLDGSTKADASSVVEASFELGLTRQFLTMRDPWVGCLVVAQGLLRRVPIDPTVALWNSSEVYRMFALQTLIQRVTARSEEYLARRRIEFDRLIRRLEVCNFFDAKYLWKTHSVDAPVEAPHSALVDAFIVRWQDRETYTIQLELNERITRGLFDEIALPRFGASTVSS